MKLNSIIAEERKRVKRNGILSRPNHYVINIPTEDEQDSFLWEFSKLMHDNGLRQFHGLDRWLYFNLDGSQKNLDMIKGVITSSAIYDNYYEGLLAFDVSKLLLPTNKRSRDSFVKMISANEYSQHATIVIFMTELTSEISTRFLEELEMQLDYKIVEYSKIR